jgi:hypothetical protein
MDGTVCFFDRLITEITEPFELRQGVRQCEIFSSHLYKQFNNDLLDLIEAQELGV